MSKQNIKQVLDIHGKAMKKFVHRKRPLMTGKKEITGMVQDNLESSMSILE
ncbi:MAG: hypothetical protein KGI02_02960 [Thaumarchaeota archaeon]|nr:hypothetical protein [Nitrososphaerota archaeon]MDE1877904.1 hypothetical protein [Nitrososphaerota archaeon]